MKRVLLLGSSGMLGHQVYFRLLEDKEVVLFDLSFRTKMRPETIVCDVTDFVKLAEIIQEIRPDYIVNCIGVLIKGSQRNPKNAILINSYLPHWLAEEADKIQCKVIHISTDCVFSGKKGAYLESDFRDADDVYGRSKALGELYGDRHLTLRTSIIGPEIKKDGEGLFHWFMKQTGTVNGYTKAFWGGVTTTELSKIIHFFLFKGNSGLINITNKKRISKFDLLFIINQAFEMNIKLIPFDSKQIDKSLDSERSDFEYMVPDYSAMVSEMKEFMVTNSNLYKHYLL